VVVGYFTGGAGFALAEAAGFSAEAATTIAGAIGAAAGAAANAGLTGGNIGQAALLGGLTGGFLGWLGYQSAIYNPSGASPFGASSGYGTAATAVYYTDACCIDFGNIAGIAGALGSTSGSYVRRVSDDDGPFWSGRRFGYRFPYHPMYQVHGRVVQQLYNRFPKLSTERLQDLVNRPGGLRVYNEDSGHYSIYRNVSGIGLSKDNLLRITLDNTSVPAKIISVGEEASKTISYRLKVGQYRAAD
jgi:hypothetical protein